MFLHECQVARLHLFTGPRYLSSQARVSLISPFIGKSRDELLNAEIFDTLLGTFYFFNGTTI
jgi:hypothetical protein